MPYRNGGYPNDAVCRIVMMGIIVMDVGVVCCIVMIDMVMMLSAASVSAGYHNDGYLPGLSDGTDGSQLAACPLSSYIYKTFYLLLFSHIFADGPDWILPRPRGSGLLGD